MKIKLKMLFVGVIVLLGLTVALYYLLGTTSAGANNSGQLVVGSYASLTQNFTLLNGSSFNLKKFYSRNPNKMVFLWFVSTWCSSCQQGTQFISDNIGYFTSHNVTIIELENYGDDGYPGPTMSSFKSFANNYNQSNSMMGSASRQLTSIMNPDGYPDIYYILSTDGKVLYIGSSPAATFSEITQAIDSYL